MPANYFQLLDRPVLFNLNSILNKKFYATIHSEIDTLWETETINNFIFFTVPSVEEKRGTAGVCKKQYFIAVKPQRF